MSTDALAMVTDDAALADHVAARRAALQDELDRIRAQKAALEAKLAELRPAAPPKKGGGVGVPAGSAGKKRPGGAGAGRPGEPPYDPSIPLTGPAKRARVEADRERRVNLLWQQCATIAKTLMRHRDSAPFHKPVDPVALKCPDYLTIIKTPMDLGTALARLGGTPGGPPRAYSAPTEFRDNVRLMFANCRTYNKVGTPVRRMGDALSDLWEKKWAQQGIEAKWALEMERQKDEQLVRPRERRGGSGGCGEGRGGGKGGAGRGLGGAWAVWLPVGPPGGRLAAPGVGSKRVGVGSSALPARRRAQMRRLRRHERQRPRAPSPSFPSILNPSLFLPLPSSRSWTARPSTSSRCARWTGSCAPCRRWPPPRAAPPLPAPPTRASAT